MSANLRALKVILIDDRCSVCPTSIDAMQGAIGTVCEAVDVIANKSPNNPCKRAFVSVRPPGHHCGEDTPSGFCFVNNVAIAAAHGKSSPTFYLLCI